MARTPDGSGRDGNQESNILTTSTNVGFDVPDTDEEPQVKLILEHHFGTCTTVAQPANPESTPAYKEGAGWNAWAAGWRCYRLYPAVAAILAASRGQVSYATELGAIQETHEELITFSNSDRASTKYPPVGFGQAGSSGGGTLMPNLDGNVDENSPIAVDLQFAFDSDGNSLGGSAGGGGLVPPGGSNDDPPLSFTFDKSSYEIVASQKFSGAIKVTYVTAFRVLKYFPDFLTTPNIYPSFTKQATTIYYGNILAFYKGSMAMIEVERPNVPDQQREKQLYTVTTQVMINSNGAWERPNNFPANVWPDQDSPQSEDDPHLSYTRTHEVGMLGAGSAGLINRKTYRIPAEQPYTGFTLPHSPAGTEYTLQFSAGTEFVATEWEDAYGTVDFDRIVERAQFDYDSGIDVQY